MLVSFPLTKQDIKYNHRLIFFCGIAVNGRNKLILVRDNTYS